MCTVLPAEAALVKNALRRSWARRCYTHPSASGSWGPNRPGVPVQKQSEPLANNRLASGSGKSFP